MTEFTGTFAVTYNTVDTDNFGFLQITSTGAATQALVVDGTANVLGEGTVDVTMPIAVRAVSAGTHFRGYADNKLVTHGHASAGRPGHVGLRVNGTGRLLVAELSAVNAGGQDH
ncbi:MAG: hypothetical protein HKN13_10230 [Rhodothermales bacterium]|nr:hypothetical protein [Rhodothermales bacterium]